MVPQIKHSRSQLRCHFNEYEDGARSLFMSSDTYPALFSQMFPQIVEKAPKGWAEKKMTYLWFPPDALDQEDLDAISGWISRFERYVLLGLNDNLQSKFGDQLDFCMALDFNYDPSSGKRTPLGEAEYQLKYQGSQDHLSILKYAMIDAISDLPLPPFFQGNVCLSCVPAPADSDTVPRRLARTLADELGLEFIDAELSCPKQPLKGVSVEDKIPIWQGLYSDGCVDLADSVDGRMVVIVDDLYQSGATMWAFAEYLKSEGASYVFGLPCVKSLRDSDNQ